MAKRRSPLTDYAVYAVLRMGVCVVQALSWRLSLHLARVLAWLIYKVDRRHREIALDNLRHAFPDLDAPALDRLARASHEHFLTMLIEMIRLPRTLNARNVHGYAVFHRPDDLERLFALTATGRPLLTLTGHFGNWELLSFAIGLYGFGGAIVARRLDNPYVDRFLARFRAKTGLRLLDKRTDYARILEILASGGGVGLVGDQDAGPRGIFASFFGRPASTFKSIALLSLEYQAPIVVVGAARVGHPFHYRIYYEDLILPEDYAHRPDAVPAITQRYTDALERMIRRHPEQYFWLHRRWKHQPRLRQARKAA